MLIVKYLFFSESLLQITDLLEFLKSEMKKKEGQVLSP